MVITGDDTALPISQIGTAMMSTSFGNFSIPKVFLVPRVKKSLLSFSQFTSDFQCKFDFTPSTVVVKDLRTGMEIARGRRHGKLYALTDDRVYALAMAVKKRQTELIRCRLPFGIFGLGMQAICFSISSMPNLFPFLL
ncbi:TPA_asm: hypothetical protein HUJ06_032026 [Nelumbo nucifera]|uniref:Uncharacterized protein n=1 Tax=Nelumbo nucifera TaxID=4432 RepID=A0A822Y346_NELNU|nr:TPA_asm: hypothetical protein HUJ06_026949 [Nelumbo nucifera]DAD25491.1 TPA_asm: hypothetical protein HUJ06_026955 [Nelumbo nucifera]DAD25570.1 TPA_asm: hypothetical protein HUJ06_027034 [Nelumbo nucifera]DAD27311.1 TPA_asm: hypothetical protein HUJ06_028778 [Nelumbo nucifera]DAD49304.1 TPA_asm: hypothetical protein HUJ06_032025 [Nelumbo nucifera]